MLNETAVLREIQDGGGGCVASGDVYSPDDILHLSKCKSHRILSKGNAEVISAFLLWNV